MNEDLNISPPHIYDYKLNESIVIGTFYDGRPIYRLYLQGNTGSVKNEAYSIGSAISNFDMPIRSEMYIRTVSNNRYIYRPLHYVMCTSTTVICGEYLIHSDGSIQVRINLQDWLNCPVYATMEYVLKG